MQLNYLKNIFKMVKWFKIAFGKWITLYIEVDLNIVRYCFVTNR